MAKRPLRCRSRPLSPRPNISRLEFRQTVDQSLGDVGASEESESRGQFARASNMFGYMNRPSELYLAERLTEEMGGAKIWLK
jgi:hypothetical protein